jgi:hypothetical protein
VYVTKDRMKDRRTEHSGLREIDDRRTIERAEHAAVRAAQPESSDHTTSDRKTRAKP